MPHPVEDDPELDERLKAAAQAERVAREVEELRTRVRDRSQSVARDFDRVLRVLENWGYVDGWTLTDAGKILAQDVPRVRPADRRVPPPRSARRSRAGGAGRPGVGVRLRAPQPGAAADRRGSRRRRCASGGSESPRSATSCEEIEEEAGLSVHRPPDPTFIAVAFAWAAGEGFAEVVEAEELSGGDFVRTMKQLIDVLRQLALVAPVRETRRSAEQAADQLFRGVVAASSAVEVSKTSRRRRGEPPTSEVMTIRKGEPWGEAAVCPSDLRVVSTDRELRDWVIWHRTRGQPIRDLGVAGGDLARTCGGATGPHPSSTKVTVDAMRVTLDDGEPTWGVAHVVARRQWLRGEIGCRDERRVLRAVRRRATIASQRRQARCVARRCIDGLARAAAGPSTSAYRQPSSTSAAVTAVGARRRSCTSIDRWSCGSTVCGVAPRAG